MQGGVNGLGRGFGSTWFFEAELRLGLIFLERMDRMLLIRTLKLMNLRFFWRLDCI